MINIAICDDEKYMSDKIRAMVYGFFRKKNKRVAVAQFSSGKELLEYGSAIDILFLDIQMDGIDGMETARKLRRRNFNGILVFITVLAEMVFQSFEVQAYDYLVKPVEEKRFEKTMERIMFAIQDTGKANLLVQNGHETIIIPFKDIIYCEVIDRKVYLHMSSSEVISYYERIGNLEAELDSRFFRCHRSYLVNMQYLKSYRKETAFMADGSSIPVSRLRGREFSNVILNYMKEWRI